MRGFSPGPSSTVTGATRDPIARAAVLRRDADDFQPSASRPAHHIRRPAAAGERQHQVWSALVKHLLIADRPGGLAVAAPVGGIDSNRDGRLAGAGLLDGQGVGPTRAASDHEFRSVGVARQRLSHPRGVMIVASATDQDAQIRLPVGEAAVPRPLAGFYRNNGLSAT
jgi:hypothetical protein